MDKIFQRFCGHQAEEAAAFNQSSDVAQVRPIVHGEGTPQHFLARFACAGFVKMPDGHIARHVGFDIGIYFPDDYLRTASTYQVLTVLAPQNVFHPNVRGAHICVGEEFLRPGTPLVELLFQLHAVLTYRRWAPHRGLNPDASQWARNHQELFPVDRRPLKRRKLTLNVQRTATAGEVTL